MTAVTESEDEGIVRANRRLLAQRRDNHIDVETGRSASPSVALVQRSATPSTYTHDMARPERRMWTAMAPLKLGEGGFGPPPEGNYRCTFKLETGERCSNTLKRPGVCASCMERHDAAERAETIRARIDANLPKLFRTVTWKTLPTLKNKSGTGPLLALALDQLAEARSIIEREHTTIVWGPTSGGKSFLAACHIRAAIEAGSERARFIPAMLLEDTDEGRMYYDLALHAEYLVIDDLGAELHSAPEEGGVLAQRIKLTSKLLGLRYNAGGRIVITSPHTREKLEGIYGDGNVRKLFDAGGRIKVGHVNPMAKPTR